MMLLIRDYPLNACSDVFFGYATAFTYFHEHEFRLVGQPAIHAITEFAITCSSNRRLCAVPLPWLQQNANRGALRSDLRKRQRGFPVSRDPDVGSSSSTLHVVLVLISEAAANSFSCFVRKTIARYEVRWLGSFGTSCFADDIEMFHVPLAPRANPEVKLQVDSLSQTQRSLH